MNSFAEIIATIKKYDKIIILRHQNPDPDALGSQAGLATTIRQAFPNKEVLMGGNDTEGLKWLSTAQEVTDADYQDALVIVTDTANQPRIDDQRFDDGAFLIKIDHHPNDDAYGDQLFVDTDASSSSEIIADLIESSSELKLTKEVAYYLYAGIVGDTGRFLYPSTTQHTMEVGGKCIALGVDTAAINNKMNEVSLKQAKLQGFIYDILNIDESGAAYAVIDLDLMKKLDINQEQANSVVSTPGRLKEVQSWMEAIQKDDGTFRMHLRSQGAVINELAKRHDGGGHPLASGATAKDLDEVKQMFEELKEIVKNYNQKGE
ncbi:phosphoesterase, DHH family protein [Companilactobacillus mindensis DSM 14500]|uniref:Phosphoesterase, DHH family protein n=1 Tax=Companilactobacillus mindensis DSM 14500 TaxID=1423770 RepID=A0A0R1QM82_9LACO|nr:bifunctional oligoribonuclease/PAP phosphatase NrnA [Companilactobacillus mindensis]KRL43796.1 phosphoesterase, DHH family protein [Companilactobacillus mindensis DSM 14500]GEO79003.1 phosphoesterase [Companilactobacillus mindensis]